MFRPGAARFGERFSTRVRCFLVRAGKGSNGVARTTSSITNSLGWQKEKTMHINFKSRTVSVLTLAVVAGALLIFAFSAPWRSSTAAAAPQSPAAVRVSPLAPQSYADVVDRVAPAVVTIHAARRVRASQQSPFLDDPLFRQFFGNPNGVTPRNNPSTLEQALGSGVIVSADGHIITNHHVIDGAEQISVDLSDKRTFQAKVIGSDDASDLAILKIEATNLPVLTLGNSDKVRVGDVCLAVGNPLGIGRDRHHGNHQRQGPRDRSGRRQFRGFPADRRRHQSGQLRRRSGGHPRRADRHQQPDPFAFRRQYRDWIRHPLEHGAQCDGPID